MDAAVHHRRLQVRREELHPLDLTACADFLCHGGRSLASGAPAANVATNPIAAFACYSNAMWNDVVDLNGFYQSPLGERARQMIRLRLRALWPDLEGMTLLGLGYAAPYLRQFGGEDTVKLDLGFEVIQREST